VRVGLGEDVRFGGLFAFGSDTKRRDLRVGSRCL
jgi:hypothetical protein